MLKLMKYDFMKVRSLIIIFGIIGVAVNGFLYLAYMLKTSFDVVFLTSTVGILATLAVIYLFSLPVFILVLSVMLYSTDISKKKGYMTFLTPHNAYSIVGSKIILSLIFMVCAVFVEMLFISLDLNLLFSDTGDDFSIFYFAKLIFEALKSYPGQIILIIIAAIIQWTANILSFYVATAVSNSIVRKGKLNFVIAAAVWIGIVAIENVIAQIASTVSIGFKAGFVENNSGTGLDFDISFPTGLFVFALVMYSVIGVAEYLVTSYLTEKKISM